ncbi:MAG: PQQ-binding-like beta-propeller repeat protein [Zavarzinella sp.]
MTGEAPSNPEFTKFKPVTTIPRGDYSIARLDLPAGLGGKAEPLFLALRDGKLVNFWFVTPQAGDLRIHLEESTISESEGRINGKLHLRIDKKSAWLTLDLQVKDETVTGQYSLDLSATAYKPAGKNTTGLYEGKVNGTYDTKLPANDHLSRSSSWTSFWGTDLDMSGGQQPKLIVDLAKARPVWRSEAYILTGYGNAPDSRYFWRALTSSNCGGGSSPVIFDNTVYITFFRPSTQLNPVLSGNPYWERKYQSMEMFEQEMVTAGANKREKNWLLNHFRPVADDVIVAMDAASGATMWITVMPMRSPNHQTHKHRGISPVPLVHGDTIFVPNLASRLYALDRVTGKLKWEYRFDNGKIAMQAGSGPANPSPLYMGGHIIWDNSGFDPVTGEKKWTVNLGHGGYIIPWIHAGKEKLLSFNGWPKQYLHCINPIDGSVLWKQESPFTLGDRGAPLSTVVHKDMLVAPVLQKKGSSVELHFEGWKLLEKGLEKAWEDVELQPDENVPITVVDGRAYFLGRMTIRCLDVVSGKLLVERKFNKHGPGSNPWLGVVADRLLFLPEGQHGTAELTFLDKNLNDSCPVWLPKNTATTAYNSQPIIYPVVDGRLFVRGGDGIYCYDLRELAKP